MPRRASNLQKRGNVFWLRVRVPDDLRDAVGKTEIRKSLKTPDLNEAERLARIKRVELDAEWTALRRKRSGPVEVLSKSELWYLTSKAFIRYEERNQRAELTPLSQDDAEYDLSMLMEWETGGASVGQEVERLLAENGIELKPGSKCWQELGRLVHAAMVEAHKRRLQRSFPSGHYGFDPQFAELNAATVLQPVATKTLKTLIADYTGDPSRRALGTKTQLKRAAQWRVLEEFFGADTPIGDISRAKVREFMDFLGKLPSNASKHFPKASLRKAAELGAARELPTLSAITANGYLRALGAVMQFAVHEGLLPSDPTAGLLFREDSVRAKDKRLPFKAVDLSRIFAAPLYTGCKDDGRGYSRSGGATPRRARFWVPLVALYTGMRLNEICQLTLDDFVVEDGVPIVLIRSDEDGETKRVKTVAGQRFVPIHSELRRIGLLAHVERCRRRASNPTDPLFPELPLGSTGYRSDPFSKFFAHFLKSVGITERRKVFHSFRHTFRDALREADLSQERVRALGGWSSGKTEDIYGSGLRPNTLAGDMEAISYPGLDLSHLYLMPSA